MYLALKTDGDISTFILFDAGGKELAREDWTSGRQLAEGLLSHLGDLLKAAGTNWDGLRGLVVFSGPGSFTGLRIGITVANTIAYAQGIPIVGVAGADWVKTGVARLAAGENDTQVTPHYGAEPNITKPKR